MSDRVPSLRDRFRGCLLGGAVGDALGAPVEFDRWPQIAAKFGEGGIRDYAPAYGRKGAITDDTQMTLFTVEGLLRAHQRGREKGICDPYTVLRFAYERWLATQEPTASPPSSPGWLFGVRALHSRRAPGNTCLSALRAPWSDAVNGIAANDSKGCGGVMRVAPIGLVEANPYEFASRAAAITHGHPLGYESAGALALIVAKFPTAESIEAAALLAMEEVKGEIRNWLQRALELARSDQPAHLAMRQLGEGWVAEEALAVGLFAALRGRDFEEAVVLAVNHSGDSDSTGSIAGQLVGTFAGVHSIPARWLDELELRLDIEILADDLYDYFHYRGRRSEEEWWQRYPGV
ncbi:ADP-ribosylglycohydrolase family protein [bacterium]|nr:MAG: ADP-ribosylglycohydrolase family protein [bacterium]